MAKILESHLLVTGLVMSMGNFITIIEVVYRAQTEGHLQVKGLRGIGHGNQAKSLISLLRIVFDEIANYCF